MKVGLYVLMLLGLVQGSGSRCSELNPPYPDRTGFITAQSDESNDIRLIREKKAEELKVTDAQGLAPIHRASKYCKPDAIEALAKKGIDVNSCTVSGKSPLALAIDTTPTVRSRRVAGNLPSTITTLIGHRANLDTIVTGPNKRAKKMDARTYLQHNDYAHLLIAGLQRQEQERKPFITALTARIKMPKELIALIVDYILFPLTLQDQALLNQTENASSCVIN